jgi:hypothetical protein
MHRIADHQPMRERSLPPAANAEPEQQRFAALGTIASSAPEAALLAALRALRPACEVQLRAASDAGAQTPRYILEVRARDEDAPGSIDTWLQLKSALMAAFPADKPNAVTAWDP